MRGESPAEARRRWVRERFLERLSEDERVLAEGRMRDHRYIVVTDRRMIWNEGGQVLMLPVQRITRAQEIFEETHRYRLRLLHEPINREHERALPWDLPRHVRRFRQRRMWSRLTDLTFSRPDTKAVVAIRQALSGAKVPFLSPVVRPHHRDKGYKVLVRMSPIWAWWHRFTGRT
jgi:hypothetical protein